MKLVCYNVSQVIEIKQGYISEIVIENQNVFRNTIKDLSQLEAGEIGQSILSINNKPVEFSKNAVLITEFAPLQFNKKTLITKIVQRMEKLSIEPENYIHTMELMSSLEKMLFELSLELPCELTFEKLNFANVIKSVGIDIAESEKDDVEKILDYMSLVRELDREKLFIFVNMRSYYTDEQMNTFLRTLLGHDYRVVLIESVAREKLSDTKRIILDKDLCEI